MADVENDVKKEEPKNKEREPFLEGENAPADHWNLVYWIVLLHGIGTLMPWNMFINIAPSYYVAHKMVIIGGGPNGTDASTWYSDHFMHYLGILSQVPNLLLNLINIFVPVKGELTPRITISLAIVGCVVAFTDAFVYIDTNTWISGFFWLTMLSIAVLNGANGVYQNSIYGMASDFPFKYTNAVIIGNNLCGTFVAIVSIVAAFLTDSKTHQAFGYFTVSLITIVCCFFSFFKLKTLRYYKYHSELGNLKRSKDDSGPPTMDDYIATFKQGWQQFMNVFLVFFVTLTIFPNIMVFIRPNLKGGQYDFILPEAQYINFCVFLLFNVFAFLGSLTANLIQFPKPGGLWVATWARVSLILLFMLCNFRPETRVWGVWFESYYIYILAAIVMSFTSGYLSSLGMMYAPRVVEDSKSRIAGMMAAFFLILGIVAGLFFTIFMAKLVDA